MIAGGQNLNDRARAASDHFDGRRFFNPGVDTDKHFRDFLRMFRTPPPLAWPVWVDNQTFPAPRQSVAGDEIALTYIGQATFLLQFDGLNVITDPNFSERASPATWFGPRRVRKPGVELDDLPRVDLILLSHNHYDHMDLPSLRRLRSRCDAPIVTGLGNGSYLARKGLGNCVELDWWQACQPCSGLRVTYVPAQHWSNRSLFDRCRMLWGGHVLESAAGRVYFAGDTGYPSHFREIGQRLGKPDIAFLPIGAYEPRWFMAAQHMNPDEAVRAHLDLGARLSIAMHFGTFRMSHEAIDAPIKSLEVARLEHGVSDEEFRVPEFGESIYWRSSP
jgi:L-ascorbate metabolism protein UlaG (beta-lactamase superfamily)